MTLKGVGEAARWIEDHYMPERIKEDIRFSNRLLRQRTDLSEREEDQLADRLDNIQTWWDNQPHALWWNSFYRQVTDEPPSETVPDELFEVADWHYYDESELRYEVLGDYIAPEIEPRGDEPEYDLDD